MQGETANLGMNQVMPVRSTGQCWGETLRSHSCDLETLMTQVLRAAGPHGQAVSSVCFPGEGQPIPPGKRVCEQQRH